jgi:hypothetical protein
VGFDVAPAAGAAPGAPGDFRQKFEWQIPHEMRADPAPAQIGR